MTRSRTTALAGLLAAAVMLTAVLLLGRGGPYVLHARFTDAGQLVRGGQVQIAGRKVGSIGRISITPHGEADVELRVTDDALTPLPGGTRAVIRAVGQAGVANRYVQLVPGPSTLPDLSDGAVLPTTQTAGIVDLDEVLNTVGPKTRGDLRSVIASSSRIYAGSGAPAFNRMLARLDPAVGELNQTAAELGLDRDALTRLVRDGATAAKAIATRRPDLRGAITNTSTTMRALATERGRLADSLQRAPDVLQRAGRTLGAVSGTVDDLRPTLRAVPAAARPLTQTLRTLKPTLRQATPVVGALNRQVPALGTVLRRMPALEKTGSPALKATAAAIEPALPILRATRIYGSDFILGVFNGLAGIATGNYNATGHYARLEFVQSPQTLPAGIAAMLLSKNALAPGVLDTRTGLTARCPGGMAPPSADGSSPWIPDASLCDPSDDRPASVNVP